MSERADFQFMQTEVQQRALEELFVEARLQMQLCEYDALCAGCESPIELAFLTALLGTLQLRNYRHYRVPRDKVPSTEAEQWIVFVEAQKQIGDFRVDFFLSTTAGLRIVIECDGHDFHERTADQAERDRSRDRALQFDNCKVFRFTGREIFRSPCKCACEVVDFISASIK